MPARKPPEDAPELQAPSEKPIEEQVEARLAEREARLEEMAAQLERRMAAMDDREADLRERFERAEAREREALERETLDPAYPINNMGAAPRERGQESRARELDSTDRLERESLDAYAPPQLLEVPVSPDYHYRWVAEWVNGAQQPRNVQIRLREGYVRVPASELPEDFLVDEDSGDGWARTTGLILMRIPKLKLRQRRAYYHRLSQDRLSAADVLQGVAGKDAVREDRGTRAITGADQLLASVGNG